VRVRKVLPNGDLYAEGTKVVMVGAEEHHVYISGVIRPQDIALDGTVSSGRVADAEIEFTGRGDINDTQRPGWLSRLFKKLWPF
jgi:flagellar L-ring protein precursor FlgH